MNEDLIRLQYELDYTVDEENVDEISVKYIFGTVIDSATIIIRCTTNPFEATLDLHTSTWFKLSLESNARIE